MTVDVTSRRSPTYPGNGVATSFAFDFRVFTKNDIEVIRTAASGTETTLVLDTDYSVSVNGDQINNPGGTVTYPISGAALPTGDSLNIVSDLDVDQQVDIANADGFPPTVVEAALDKVTMLVQEIRDTQSRTLTLPTAAEDVSVVLPSPIAGYALLWNASGNALISGMVASAPVSAFMATVLDDTDAASARATLGVPAAANGTHTGTTSVQTLAASVAATVPTVTQGDADGSAVSTAFVAAAIQPTFSYIFNGDGRLWGAGFSASPSGWVLAGAGASVARNTTAGRYRWGASGVDLTRSGTDCSLSQTATSNPAFSPAASWAGKTITVGAWVYATVANRARVTISDSVNTVSSSFHPGDSTLRFLTATITVDAAVTAISMGCSVAGGNTTATFSGMTLALGAYLQDSVASYGARKCIIPFHLQAGATVAAGTTGFYHTAGADSAEANANVGVPFRGVARNLYCNSGGSPGAAQTYTYTLRRGGSDTTVTATISGASSVNASDTTNQAEYAPGQTMCLRVVASGGAASTGGVGAYLEYEEVPVA